MLQRQVAPPKRAEAVNILDIDLSKTLVTSPDLQANLDAETSESFVKKPKAEPFILLSEERTGSNQPETLQDYSSPLEKEAESVRLPSRGHRGLEIEVDSKSADTGSKRGTHYLSTTATKGLHTPGYMTAYSQKRTYQDKVSDRIQSLSRSIDESVDDKEHLAFLNTFSHSLNAEFRSIFRRIEKTSHGNPRYTSVI